MAPSALYNTVEDLPGAKFADILKAIFSHNKNNATTKAEASPRQSRATSKANTPAPSTQASRSASVSSTASVSKKLYQGGFYPC